MIEQEIKVSKRPDDSAVAVAVQDVCKAEGLELQMKTSLKQYPGCTHWHFKRSSERGILELTWWPGEAEKRASRLWLSIHGNRQAEWISELIPKLKALIEKRLNVSS
ncbi:MAG: hypothetical protein AAF665_05415 [Pseudomonadota bacterium]